MENLNLIKKFLSVVNTNIKEDILDFFSDETIFNNIPMGAVTGKEEIWKVLALLHEQSEKIHWELHNIAESENGEVLTERTDNFYLADKTISCRVMGIFEVRDNKIIHWRDYFDMQQIISQL